MRVPAHFLFLSIFVLLSGSLLGKEQEFHFNKPDAQSVELMGEFNNWKALPMTKQSDGTWATTISIPVGRYGYKFLVNGSEWVFDPQNPSRKTVNGIENSAIEISDGSPAATAGRSLENAASSSKEMQSGVPITPGEILNLDVALSARRRTEAAQAGNPHLTHAKMAIAVPQNFDPQKTWPVLVINNTLDASNLDAMNQFKQAAVDEGWVIMAADPPPGEKDGKAEWRWPTIAAAMDYVVAAWPGAKDWPVACGGMSGGGKNSTFIAADFARDHRRVIGMLMMGCNQDMATVAFRRSAPPNFLGVPIFLSSGKSDTIASPAQHEEVKNSLRSTGFQKVRLESFDGGHDIHQPHIAAALKWFAEQSSRTAPTQRASSDFDKFFKNKP